MLFDNAVYCQVPGGVCKRESGWSGFFNLIVSTIIHKILKVISDIKTTVKLLDYLLPRVLVRFLIFSFSGRLDTIFVNKPFTLNPLRAEDSVNKALYSAAFLSPSSLDTVLLYGLLVV